MNTQTQILMTTADVRGNDFAKVERETLSDNSYVYNVIFDNSIRFACNDLRHADALMIALNRVNWFESTRGAN